MQAVPVYWTWLGKVTEGGCSMNQLGGLRDHRFRLQVDVHHTDAMCDEIVKENGEAGGRRDEPRRKNQLAGGLQITRLGITDQHRA